MRPTAATARSVDDATAPQYVRRGLSPYHPRRHTRHATDSRDCARSVDDATAPAVCEARAEWSDRDERAYVPSAEVRRLARLLAGDS